MWTTHYKTGRYEQRSAAAGRFQAHAETKRHRPAGASSLTGRRDTVVWLDVDVFDHSRPEGQRHLGTVKGWRAAAELVRKILAAG